ncbi:unnamed protein product, partial [Onchocerca ochengi]|uniref:CACTA en-spm transposon protein n=1 Tax=Onchocerca ochengi TaxID=42157 RepID=A0A182ES65_ONCOC
MEIYVDSKLTRGFHVRVDESKESASELPVQHCINWQRKFTQLETVMIKRTCFTLLNTTRVFKVEARTISRSHKRLLLRDNFPTSTTRFSFSAAVQKEGSNEASSFSLKHENARLT